MVFPLTEPHMHIVHDQAASYHVTWYCTFSPQVPRQTPLTERWEETSAPWLLGRWHLIPILGKEDDRMTEPPTASTAHFLSMHEVCWEKEVLKMATQAKGIILASCLQSRHPRAVIPSHPLGTFWTGLDQELHPRAPPGHTCTRWCETK